MDKITDFRSIGEKFGDKNVNKNITSIIVT